MSSTVTRAAERLGLRPEPVAHLPVEIGELLDAEYRGSELRIHFSELGRRHGPHRPQGLARGRRRHRHDLRPVEREAGVLDHLVHGVTGVHTGEREAPACAVERKQAAIGDQRDRPAGALHVGRA